MERIVQSRLIPAWTGRAPPNAAERNLFALPARLGGPGIIDPSSCSSSEFCQSVKISSPLTNLILQHRSDYPPAALAAQLSAKLLVNKERLEATKSAEDALRISLDDSQCYAITLAKEKGASSWLTSLPLEEFCIREPSEMP